MVQGTDNSNVSKKKSLLKFMCTINRTHVNQFYLIVPSR